MLSLSQFLDNFCESSGYTKDSELCSELMKQQPDNLVPSVYNLLAASRQFALIPLGVSKVQIDAEMHMARGERALAANNFPACVGFYTVVIALLPLDSILVHFAYARRATALFQLKRYSASIMDLNRALKGEAVLPDDVKCELVKRKGLCVAALKQEQIDRANREKVMSLLTSACPSTEEKDKTKKKAQKQEDDKSLAKQPTTSDTKKKKSKKHKKPTAKMELIDDEMIDPNNEDKFPLPLIADPNEKIPNASAKVNISFSEDYGRHLVATDDIKPGELLLAERAYASVLYPHAYLACCRYCYISCEALIPCPKCLLSTYCSESCRSKAFDEFHRVECPILYTLTKLEVAYSTHLALRLLLKATRQGADLSTMIAHPTYKSPMNIRYGPIEGQFLSDDYNNVHNLMDHRTKLAPFVLFRKCCEAAVLLFLLKRTTFFGTPVEDDSEMSILCPMRKYSSVLHC